MEVPWYRVFTIFSSKDEYLRENVTTGELYIDTYKPEFMTLNDLQQLICSALGITDINELYKKKVVVLSL